MGLEHSDYDQGELPRLQQLFRVSIQERLMFDLISSTSTNAVVLSLAFPVSATKGEVVQALAGI